MQYPSGTAIEPETLNGFFAVFDRHFGGSSPLGVIDGHWMGVTEPMLRVEVAVPADQIQRFETIARLIGKTLKQREVYVVINWQASAKSLLVFEDEEDDDDLMTKGAGA